MSDVIPHATVYLDFQATTPVDPRVLQEMLPYFTKSFGNPASRSHSFGWTAEAAVTHARERIAKAIGATPSEIIFTSGATESNNLAIRGAALEMAFKGKHIITSAIEHKSVLDPIRNLQEEGFEITEIGVSRDGFVDVEEVASQIRNDTILVSIMTANNETGVLQPVSAIGALCKEKGVWFHSDATQALGKIPIDVNALGVDLLSFSGHKTYGPKGIGGLYMRRKKPKVKLTPILLGGGQENGLRSGTLNVPGIVGLASAVDWAVKEQSEESKRLSSFRERAWTIFQKEIPGAKLNGHPTQRLPHALNVSFGGVHSEALVIATRDVAISSGAACASVGTEPSYVLRAMGIPDEEVLSSVRMSFGRTTTEEDFKFAMDRLVETAKKMAELKEREGEANDYIVG